MENIEVANNKVWVTVSINLNLTNYENVKVDSGYSKTITEKENPIDLIEEMQDEIAELVMMKAKQIKKEYSKHKRLR
jgi:hypothetical protein